MANNVELWRTSQSSGERYMRDSRAEDELSVEENDTMLFSDIQVDTEGIDNAFFVIWVQMSGRRTYRGWTFARCDYR